MASVLVVDDEPLIRWSVRTHLEHAGFRVLDADSGREALDRLGEQIDVALVDLRLPDADGLELIEELRRRQPRCRVILMTANGTPDVTRRARETGVRTVVDKPFDLDRLTAAIEDEFRGEAST